MIMILFIKKSGIYMAQRMRELFENSFPSSALKDLDVRDYKSTLKK